MKSVIDVSVYIIVMTIMCFISLDFILINRDISEKQKTIDYIKDYVELYGTSMDSGKAEAGRGKIYALSSDVWDSINDIAHKNGIDITVTYEDETDRYYYYNMSASYNIQGRILGINKVQKSRVYIRTEAEQMI